jgi:toxin CptA
MLQIAIKPSRQLAALLCLAHAAAAAAVLVIDLPLWLSIVLVLAVGTSCGAYLHSSALLRGGGAVVGLEINDDGALSYQMRGGEWREGKLLGSSFVSSYLTILNIRTAGKFFARHVVIVPGAVDAEDFRRLRVLLRCGAHEAAQRLSRR